MLGQKNKTVFITGGCGYKGNKIVPLLLQEGYKVRVLDLMWFGNDLEPHPNLTVMSGSVMDVQPDDLSDIDVVIHLASVANDPCTELDEALSWETSCLGTMKLASAAATAKIETFIYASSGSVYGISDAERVVEDTPLLPISVYNKGKMCAERILTSYRDFYRTVVLRPATVCGYSRRTRLDVAVNLLTMQALETGKIRVFGGGQVRPNIHINDIAELYLFAIKNDFLEGIYNAGFENMSILNIARLITEHVDAEIIIEESSDPRSYRLDSTKLLRTGFSPRESVASAIVELIDLYRANILKNNDRFHNLKHMKQTGVA